MKNQREKQRSRLPKGWGGHSFEVVTTVVSIRAIQFENKKYRHLIHLQ